jgi:hypothetical protein
LAHDSGVRVSDTTVGRMLAALGARWGMARPTVACPLGSRAQARRVRAIERRLATLPAGEEAFYEDEVDIHLNPRIGRDWMLPGDQKTVLTPGQNQKHYLAGALHTPTGQVFWVGNGRKNSYLFLQLLADLDPTRGGEIAKTCPVVVVSLDAMNRHRDTVVVCPLTTCLRRGRSRWTRSGPSARNAWGAGSTGSSPAPRRNCARSSPRCTGRRT